MKARNFIFAKRNKFNAQTQTVDGITFHSKKEASYYLELKMLMKGKAIKSFERQVKFDLLAWSPIPYAGESQLLTKFNKKVCSHIVDFLVTTNDGTYEVHEVKGFATDIWDLKHKLFEANYPEIPYRVIR